MLTVACYHFVIITSFWCKFVIITFTPELGAPGDVPVALLKELTCTTPRPVVRGRVKLGVKILYKED